MNRCKLLIYYYTRLLAFSLLLFSLFSCNKENSTGDGLNTGSFIKKVETQYAEKEIYSVSSLGSDPSYQPTWLISFNGCSQLIVADPFEKIIVLLNGEGVELSRAGGIGRGPGEFQSILHLHIGKDNRLYVVDALEFRISIYTIIDKKLEYVKSVPFKNPSNYYLNSVYVTEHGNFGVYQVFESYFTPDNKFFLYRLDDNFSPIEQLLEMPGHERRKIESSHFTFYSPYKYLSQTIWYYDSERFYFITTIESIVHAYDVTTGEKEKITYLKLDERANSNEFTRSVKSSYPVEDEDYWDTLEQIDKLPLFNGFLANGEDLYLALMPTPGKDGMLLALNLDSEEVTTIRTPQEFIPRTACRNSIFGINFRTDADSEILNVVFDPK